MTSRPVRTDSTTRCAFPAISIATLCFASCLSGGSQPPLDASSIAGPRCQVTQSHTRPLIVEWPASDRMDLETMLHDGEGIVVRYSGCELELLRNCRAKGGYRYVAGTRQDEEVVIHDADELFAKMPLGAANLEAVVSQGKELDVKLSVVGKHVFGESRVRLRDLRGAECGGATHVVVGLTVGSFEMSAKSMRSAGADVGVVRGKTSGRTEVLRQAGSASACDQSTPSDPTPPDGCGAMLRLELGQLECPVAQHFMEGKGCVVSGQQDDAPLQQGEDAALATLIMESAYTMLGTILGEESDPRFDVHVNGDMNKHRRAVQKAGARPKLQYVVGTVRGWSPISSPEKAVEVRALFHMFPPNSIRWGGLEVRVEKTQDAYGLLGSFDNAQTAWQATRARIQRSFADPSCRMTPALSPAETLKISLTSKQREDWNSFVSDYAFSAERCKDAKQAVGPWQMIESNLYAVFGQAPDSVVLIGTIEARKGRVTLNDVEVGDVGE